MSQEANASGLPSRKMKRKCWGTNHGGKPSQALLQGGRISIWIFRTGDIEARTERSVTRVTVTRSASVAATFPPAIEETSP